jgi:hypothetical protein
MNAGRSSWVTADYDDLSWHHNHVHGLAIQSGPHGCGDLILDIDFIVEWVQCGERFEFILAPADLVFHSVSRLKVEVDYENPQAAITPFSISGIERELVSYPTGYTSYRWSIEVNWPEGLIEFAAPGFTQTLRSTPIRVGQQFLETHARTKRGGV